MWHQLALIVGLLTGLSAGPTHAAETPQITATLSENKIRPQDQFELSIVVKTEDSVSVSTPQWNIPSGVVNQGLQTRTALESHLVPGPQGMQFDKKRSVEFVYSLKASKEGSYKLGPFALTVDDKNYSVGPVQIEVSGKAPAPRRGQLGGQLPPGFDEEDESLFGQLLQRQMPQMRPEKIPSRQLPVNEKEAFFVTVETDKKEAFEGEQVFASWYIYTRGNIHQFDRLKFPSLKGFWKEDVEPAPNLNFEKEEVNGVLFQRALLASYALFPIKKGQAVIDEYKIRALVSLPQDSMGGFAFAQPYSYTRTSSPLVVTVKPLPEDNKPLNFSGAVGNFKVEAHVDNQSFTQGQPFSLKIRFDGDGNAKLIELPKIQWPEAFELYDTKAESRFFQSGKSYKEFTLLVIPKQAGVVKVPPLEFSYFDPVTATYKSTQTQEIVLQVAPGALTAGASERMKTSAGVAKEAGPPLPLPVETLTSSQWRWISGFSMLYVWTFFYVALFILFIGVHWLWLQRLYHGRSLKDDLVARRQRWEKAIKQGDKPLAATEAINAIYFLLSRLVDDGGLTKDLAYLLDQLPPSIRSQVADPLYKELDVLQTVAFAPNEVWARLAQDDEFRKHTEKTYQLLEQTLSLAEEGTRPLEKNKG